MSTDWSYEFALSAFATEPALSPAPNSPPQSNNNQQPVTTTTKNTDEARKNTESLYYDTPSRPESPFEKEVVVAMEEFGGEERVKIQIKEDKVDI